MLPYVLRKKRDKKDKNGIHSLANGGLTNMSGNRWREMSCVATQLEGKAPCSGTPNLRVHSAIAKVLDLNVA